LDGRTVGRAAAACTAHAGLRVAAA